MKNNFIKNFESFKNENSAVQNGIMRMVSPMDGITYNQLAERIIKREGKETDFRFNLNGNTYKVVCYWGRNVDMSIGNARIKVYEKMNGRYDRSSLEMPLEVSNLSEVYYGFGLALAAVVAAINEEYAEIMKEIDELKKECLKDNGRSDEIATLDSRVEMTVSVISDNWEKFFEDYGEYIYRFDDDFGGYVVELVGVPLKVVSDIADLVEEGIEIESVKLPDDMLFRGYAEFEDVLNEEWIEKYCPVSEKDVYYDCGRRCVMYTVEGTFEELGELERCGAYIDCDEYVAIKNAIEVAVEA